MHIIKIFHADDDLIEFVATIEKSRWFARRLFIQRTVRPLRGVVDLVGKERFLCNLRSFRVSLRLVQLVQLDRLGVLRFSLLNFS